MKKESSVRSPQPSEKRWINTRVVYDIETGLIVEREGFWYDGEIAEAKQGKGGSEKIADANSAQAKAIMEQDQQNNQNLLRDSQGLTNKAQGTLDQFEGPVQQSPFYNALLSSGIESTSRNYQAARANTAARARQAGFGYTSPIAQGADREAAQSEASALSDVPRRSLLSAAPLALEASGQTGNLAAETGNRANQQGNLALGFGNQSQDWFNTSNNLAQQRARSRMGLMKSIAGVGLMAAAPFTGGMSAAAPGIFSGIGGGLLGNG